MRRMQRVPRVGSENPGTLAVDDVDGLKAGVVDHKLLSAGAHCQVGYLPGTSRFPPSHCASPTFPGIPYLGTRHYRAHFFNK